MRTMKLPFNLLYTHEYVIYQGIKKAPKVIVSYHNNNRSAVTLS